jgi:hypothetical protein
MLLPCGIATAFSAKQVWLSVAVRLSRLSVVVKLTNLIPRHRTDLSKTDKFGSGAYARTAPLSARRQLQRLDKPSGRHLRRGLDL